MWNSDLQNIGTKICLQKSHFLSAEECITAADFQNKHPNPCRLSPDGHFGSKFVTVVVTGTKRRMTACLVSRFRVLILTTAAN